MEARLAVLGVDGVRNKAGKSFIAKGVAFGILGWHNSAYFSGVSALRLTLRMST